MEMGSLKRPDKAGNNASVVRVHRQTRAPVRRRAAVRHARRHNTNLLLAGNIPVHPRFAVPVLMVLFHQILA